MKRQHSTSHSLCQVFEGISPAISPTTRTKKIAKEEQEKKEIKKRKRKWKPSKWPENSYVLLYDMGKMLKRKGELQLAIECLDQAISLHPPERMYAKILLEKSECKVLMGDYSAASMNVRLAEYKGANTTACNEVKGSTMYEMCEYEAALVNYHKANRSQPKKLYQDGILRCRQTIEESIGPKAGPILKERLRWIRIMEDIRQRALYGASYGSAQKDPSNQRPISRTIIAAFLAAGDISRGHKNIDGVLLGKNQGSETILPNQEDVTRVRKSVDSKMTRHYLGRFTDDFHFIEKLVSTTNQMAEHCAERNYGFWAVKDPTAAVYSPANPIGSCSMINEARDMLALIKGIRENLRAKEPYHEQLARARSYAEREKRRREKEKAKKGLDDDNKKGSSKMTWSKLEMARQTAWKHLEAVREALRRDQIPRCVSYGERAREIAEQLPYQAFSLGRKESTFVGKSSYVRTIAREIGKAYLFGRKVQHGLSEKDNREILVHLGLSQSPTNSVVIDETVTDSKFPFRDPHRLILKCENWLGITSKEPRTSLSYKPNPETRHIESPKSTPSTSPIKACGGELEKAWLYHEIARCRLRIGHIDLAKHYGRLAIGASKRAIAEEHDNAGFGEDEWGGTSKENQKWTAAWLVNALILIARVESINGTMDDSEAALVTALEEVKKRFPECENAQEWIRLAIRTVKWVRQEISALKCRARRGSILSNNTIKQISDSLGLPPAALQKYGISSSRRFSSQYFNPKHTSTPRNSI